MSRGKMVAGTDKNDPCDPNPECSASTPTPPEKIRGFEAIFAILGLLAVAYLSRRRKK